MKIISIVLVCSFIVGCSFTIGSFNLGPKRTDKPREVVLEKGDSRHKILMVSIDGLISLERRGNFLMESQNMVSELREQLDLARDDRKIKAVLVRINSRGGTLGASQMIYDELKRFKEETKDYLVSIYLEVAASGGLYVSMPSDAIIAYPSTITGSMGVIFFSPNLDGLEKKVGVGYRVVKTGKYKDMGTIFRDWPKDEQSLIETMISEYLAQFKQVVLENRKPKGLVMSEFEKISDARVLTAQQAKDMKLIDEIGYIDDAKKYIQKKLNIDSMPLITYTRYPEDIQNYYRSYEDKASIDLNTVKGFLDPMSLANNQNGILSKGFYLLWY